MSTPAPSTSTVPTASPGTPRSTTSHAFSTPAIALSDLRKTFGAVQAVNGLDLSVGPGEVVAFLGPNGAGKSTTLDMVLGLTQPTSGTVRVLGSTPRRAVAQGRIGAVLQDGGLTDNFTVAETLRATASMQSHRGDLGDLVRQTDLAGILRRQVERCSGGERQRLRLALALMTAPALLVLDEPTAGMDVTSRIAFWDTMRSQSHSGRTIVFATHYLEEAASFADRIVIIASGRLVADGSVDQIRAMGEGALVTASWPGLTPQDLDRAWAAAAERVPVLAASLLSRTVRGEHLEIRTTAPDDVARWLLTATPAENLGVSATSLDDVFTALTTTPAGA